MYETYIFDLDGTLLNTLDDLTDAVNAALTKFDRPTRTVEEVRSFIGNGLVKLIERSLGSEEKNDLFYGVFQAFKLHYREHNRDKTAPYAGVVEVLEKLVESGKKCAVVSNKADDAVQQLVPYYFGDLIFLSVGENEAAGVRRKPCPDALLKVMDALGANEKTAVYIGDSEVDIETAKNAGLDCISVTWGFKDEAFLLEHGATKVVKKPIELLKI